MCTNENIFLSSNPSPDSSHCYKNTSLTRLFSLSRNWLEWATFEILTAGLLVFWDIIGNLWAGIEVQTL
jgi:hypothetical protein